MSVLSLVRKTARVLLPRRKHPLLDGPVKQVPKDESFERVYLGKLDGSFLLSDEEYVRARYAEACRFRTILAAYVPSSIEGRPARVLDIGGGNGAVELALSAAGYLAVSVEMLWNDTARSVHDAVSIPLRRVIATAAGLPFRLDSFDGVTCIDTLEHVKEPKRVASEIFRVLRPNAVLLITTPPRLRYLFRRDPHFGIRGLVLLPSRLQRLVAQRRGFGDLYYVDRIYNSVPQIRALFPRHEVLSILSRSRAPKLFFWDAILLKKPPA